MVTKKLTLESFVGTFHIVPMETNTDNNLITLDKCRQKVLDNINYNLGQYRNNLWTRETNVRKMLTVYDIKSHLYIFTIRLGNKEIYKCNLTLKDLTSKLDFLSKIYEAVSNGCLDTELLAYSQSRKSVLQERKKKKSEKRKAKRLSERQLFKKLEAEAIKHLPRAK